MLPFCPISYHQSIGSRSSSATSSRRRRSTGRSRRVAAASRRSGRSARRAGPTGSLCTRGGSRKTVTCHGLRVVEPVYHQTSLRGRWRSRKSRSRRAGPREARFVISQDSHIDCVSFLVFFHTLCEQAIIAAACRPLRRRQESNAAGARVLFNFMSWPPRLSQGHFFCMRCVRKRSTCRTIRRIRPKFLRVPSLMFFVVHSIAFFLSARGNLCCNVSQVCMVHLIVAITGALGALDSHRCSGAADPGADC